MDRQLYEITEIRSGGSTYSIRGKGKLSRLSEYLYTKRWTNRGTATDS